MRVQSFTWVFGPEELAANGTACAVAADDIVRLHALLPSWSLNVHPSLVCILSDFQYAMRPFEMCRGLALDVLDEQLAKEVERQHHHAVRVVCRKMLGGGPRHERGVGLAPGHVFEGEAAGFHIVENTGAVELVGSWGGIVCCARLVVDLCVGVEEIDFHALFGEEEAEDETRWACADDDDLLRISLVPHFLCGQKTDLFESHYCV